MVEHHKECGSVLYQPLYGIHERRPYKSRISRPQGYQSRCRTMGNADGTFSIANIRPGKYTLHVFADGIVGELVQTGIIARHGSSAIWYEREVVFDAALMNQGTNKIIITVPEGPVNNGMKYDYIRLELDENATVPIPGNV